MKKISGISLIEVLIVVAIVAIIALFGGLNLFGIYKQKALENNAAQIAFSLRAAREKSMSQEDSAQWGVYFGNLGKPFYAVGQVQGALFIQNSTVTYKLLDSPVQYDNIATGGAATVYFSKIYGLPSGSSSIIISLRADSSQKKTIIVNENGEISY